ncbi:hypothetical protein N7530_008908 [Penicillium desertorum]|uniref:NACHT domain-containing protein n=1 Tax=Penicillium desertorum TaxID=1303715 RepID=A0A9W9WQA3_9EURO|nr:hypothetical protein N7530_008908 [Penicillium desertorum]
MDALSPTASVIAVIQLAGSIVKICGDYIQDVKGARDEIFKLQLEVTHLTGVLQELKLLLQSPNGSRLSTSQALHGPITMCFSILAALEVTLGPGKRTRAMRRLGLRALAWPLKRTEVEQIVSDLERYKSILTLSLQIDQTWVSDRLKLIVSSHLVRTIITGISKTTDRIDCNMDLKQLPVARGAEFDSYTNQYEDYCHPGTRTDILRQIMGWARSPRGKCIFWLNGRAGTGKSTISRTMAKTFEDFNLLGASFFFKRGEGDRGNAIKLFPTITRQLARIIPQLIPGVQKAIHDNSDIATKGLMEQFDKLLFQPLLELNPSALSIPIVVIVIDALDECDVDNDMRLVLQLLPLLQKVNTVRLRFLLTSRPELPIRLGFSNMADHNHEDFHLHEISKAKVEEDISLFLSHRLSKIRMDRSLPSGWPGVMNIQILVALSVPLFIFASTICRILEDPHWDPEDSLHEILTHRNNGSKLDGTYLPVLNRLLNKQSEKQKKQLVEGFQQVVGAIVILESPLSVSSLSRLLDLPERLLHLRLNQLHSVLSVPDDETLPVRLYHLSFREFLLDAESREKTPFWVDEKEMHYKLTTRCLRVCQDLRKNICGLPSYGTQRAEIDQQTIDQSLSSELQYSCRYWAHHLMQCTDLHVIMHDAHLFLQKHFLHWVEAMSLLGLGSEVVGIINLLQTGIAGSNNNAMSEFLYDAKRFVLKNRQIADDVPLQLYCSGLVFAPRKSIIRRNFKSELPNWIRKLPKVEETWAADFQALEGHSDWVSSVAFSPQGGLLASGSYDKTIRIWDTATGALRLILNGHLGLVESVAFSPDGQRLVSGSEDKTIRLWDIATGTLQQTLKGHSGWVSSVTFSPQGGLLASGSYDKTIRIWNSITGAAHHTLEGHSDWVKSVAFSPDGRRLASGSEDKTIRLWDTATGVIQQTLHGHSGWIESVVFSPDGQSVVSSSEDESIRIWNAATGALRQTLEGHSGRVSSVAFSPDGKRLVSGSEDDTVRLWDFPTGTLQQTLEGHSGWVKSVAFSPNAGLLASGSWDMTVRLWYASTMVPRQGFERHSGRVDSVAFSPDDRLLASGSEDGIVRLWDAATCRLQRILEGHSDHVSSVVFSPDGRLLASGSDDGTICLWDATTCSLRRIFEGHPGRISSVGFSSDSRLLASGPKDDTAQLWDASTGALERVFEGHSGWVQSVTFSPESRQLASSSFDKTIRLWDTTTGALKQTVIVEGVFSISKPAVASKSPTGPEEMTRY